MVTIVGILCHQYDINLSARCFTVVNDETGIIVATVVVVAAAVSCCAVTKMMWFYTTACMKKKAGQKSNNQHPETRRNTQKYTETHIVVSAPCATHTTANWQTTRITDLPPPQPNNNTVLRRVHLPFFNV